MADLQEAFLSALELDSEGVDNGAGYGAALRLVVMDQGVLLNSLATATLSIESLRDMISGYLLPPGGDVAAPHMPSLAIAVEELDRCWQIYDGLLEAEVNALERSHMLGAIDASIKKLLLVHPSRHGQSDDGQSCSADRGVYLMTGDELDRVQKDAASAVNPLVECIRALFAWTQEDADEATGSSGTSRAPRSGLSDVVVASASRRGDGQGSEQDAAPRMEGLWRNHVSRAALLRVLLCVATTINDGIMHVILGTTVEAGELCALTFILETT